MFSVAEQQEFANETRREQGRRQRAAEEAELKRQWDARLELEAEKKRQQEEAIKTADQKEKVTSFEYMSKVGDRPLQERTRAPSPHASPWQTPRGLRRAWVGGWLGRCVAGAA